MKRKRLIALALCLAAVLALAGCGDSAVQAERSQAIAVLNGEDTESYSLSTGTTLEAQTLYSSGDIEVALAGITGTPDDFELVLAVKNGSRSDIDLTVNSMTLDGWSVNAWSTLYNVRSHSVAMGTIQCDPYYGGWYAPEDVGEITLNMTIFDAGTYEDIAADLRWELTTSAGPQENTVPTGVELVSEGGLTVTLIECYSDRYDSGLTLYLSNETGHDVELSCTSARVDGSDVSAWLWEPIAQDGQALARINLFSEDGDAIPLTADSVITMELELTETDHYRTLLTRTVRFSPAELEGFVPYAEDEL